MPLSVSNVIGEILDLCAIAVGVSQATSHPPGCDTSDTLENIIHRIEEVLYAHEQTYPISQPITTPKNNVVPGQRPGG